MDTAIDASSVLDCIEFQIVPSQNRYEAYVCYENKKEKVSSGLLEYLLMHSPEIKALHSKGSNAKFELSAPENSNDIKWFSKSTLIRFLRIVGSAEILDTTNSLKNEISQLAEARRFHLSLYAKDNKYLPESGQSDDSCSEDAGSTPKAEGSNSSKNELLRAMDVRLTALRGELTTAFDQSAGSKYSLEEMTDVHKFSQHFGSKDLSDSLSKYIETRQSVESTSSRNKSLSSEIQVKYGVSPAKAAQVERQSSAESDGLSFSSDEERPSVDRSRTLIRSASPRRSASPMRRVQIGRSGSRRSTAITIKSLNFIPAREKSFFPRDENDSDEEGPKKFENSLRMSVQDKINLFESKQKDQRGDVNKAKSLLNANKSVLRRWSSGMGEDTSVEDTKVQNNVENTEIIETCEKVVESETKIENGACSLVLVSQEEPVLTESTDVNEKSNASAEWSRRKEAELNELFTKMMETKPVKSRVVAPAKAASSKRQSLPCEQSGGFYDHNKEKRDEKLRVEASRKKTEKEKLSRAAKQVPDVKKSKLTPVNASDDSKKRNVKKIQKPQTANPKTESPRLGIVKKDASKPSSGSATRKSWPSIPSARAPGLSPAQTPPATTSSTNNATSTRRRSQTTTPPLSQSSSKSVTPQTRAKPVKSNPSETKKSLRSDPEKNTQSLTKATKTVKSKVVQTAPKDLASSTKPKLYSKATKKSSVVPIESKPSLKKVYKTNSSVTPTVTKKPSHPRAPLRKSEDQALAPAQENVTVVNSSVPVTHQEEKETEELVNPPVMELGPTPRTPEKCENNGFSQISPVTDANGVDRLVLPEFEPEAEEELTISPSAWVEIEENEDHQITSDDSNVGLLPADIHVAQVEVSSPRVRHSLSQMLLEESSEPDFVEWGNAENPAPMVYQKDAPKGLKRLLKFARKSKNEANTMFSEGEDDADDSKLTNKRSGENLLRKSTLHSMNNGHQKSGTSDYEHPAEANVSKLNAQSLQQFQQGHVSASVTTTKATRSFFSLSAFKGGK